MIAQDLKPHLDRLWSLPRITREDVTLLPRDQTPHRVCACADKASALFYACKKNATASDNASLLITFEADISEVIVDGRDFLYTLFQGPDRARGAVERVFGSAILRYVDRAWATDGHDQDQRISICDLAVQDDEVIRAHARNATVIGGRYNTEFRSAFTVRMPIPSDHIVSVERISAKDVRFPDPDITLEMVLR
jgi:hypothetical protein